MTNSKLSTRFINTYNELSEYMESYLHLKEHRSHVQMLRIMTKKSNIIKSAFDELRTFANLRNIMVHDSTGKYNPIAQPHEEVVKRYEQILLQLKNPPTAYDVSTKAKDLIFARPDMRLVDCIKMMHDKNYSYMPVCVNFKIIGVLSGDSIFTYMRKNITTTIHKEFTVNDLGDCIVNHLDERFDYVAKDTPLSDIIDMYSNDIQDGKRLGAVFVTKTGKDNEKIMGMISAWDLIDHIGRE